MTVSELMELLSKADPNSEVVIACYSGEYYAGIEEATPETVYPWDGDCYTDPEPAFVLKQTHETVAATSSFTPD